MKNSLFPLLSGLLVFSFMGCSSFRKKDAEPGAPTQVGYEKLSLEELQGRLGLDLEDLGSMEARFNSCSLSTEERQDNQPCGDRFFTVLHFRVQCRNSTGTTQSAVTDLDLKALKKDLEWVVGRERGQTATDQDGYGEVRIISKKSVMKQRFVLKHGKRALGLTLEDVSRIIVPGDWCGKH